jgi:hypothetical protein
VRSDRGGQLGDVLPDVLLLRQQRVRAGQDHAWWLRGFARHQPATPVTETIRGLLLRQPGGVPLGTALAWCGGLLAVSVALSAWLYRRRTT